MDCLRNTAKILKSIANFKHMFHYLHNLITDTDCAI